MCLPDCLGKTDSLNHRAMIGSASPESPIIVADPPYAGQPRTTRHVLWAFVSRDIRRAEGDIHHHSRDARPQALELRDDAVGKVVQAMTDGVGIETGRQDDQA